MAIVLHTGLFRQARTSEEIIHTTVDPAGYREFVFRCALAICGEPDGAEDVAQEVLLILLRTHGRFSSFENPTAWVRRVTARCATRYLKRQRSTEPLPEGLRSAEISSDDLAVYEVLRNLPPEHRALLGMALNQGLSYREIGEALDIPEGTVASRLNTAKKEFQRRWER
jgi:RNA polymerase sigma-70 factor (ECF subfamily)